MKLKFALLVSLFSLGLFASLRAADIAFVYPNAETVLKGKPTFASVVQEGILAPADVVLLSSGEVFVGIPGDVLRKASLIRLDKNINVALLRIGDRVVNPELQIAHRKRALQLQSFLPTQITVAISSDTTELDAAEAGDALVSSGTAVFQILLDGLPLNKDVRHFKARLNKSKFTVELVPVNTDPLNGFTFRIHANPKLGFWSLERALRATDTPRYVYEYKNAAEFSSTKGDAKFKLPLEAHYISAKDYELILEVESNGHVQREKVFFHFD